MPKHQILEEVEKKYRQKDKRKKPKMRVSGKSVQRLQKLISQKKS